MFAGNRSFLKMVLLQCTRSLAVDMMCAHELTIGWGRSSSWLDHPANGEVSMQTSIKCPPPHSSPPALTLELIPLPYRGTHHHEYAGHILEDFSRHFGSCSGWRGTGQSKGKSCDDPARFRACTSGVSGSSLSSRLLSQRSATHVHNPKKALVCT